VRAVFTFALLAVLSACVVTVGPVSTTAPVVVGTTTTITENGRSLEVLGCEDAPEEAAIVCEAYDLIRDNYVDEIADPDLAAAATNGLGGLDGTSAKSAMVCLAPSQDFVEVCSDAPLQAEDTVEAAEAMVWGMVSFALDPNSAYLDAALVDLIEQEQGGEVEGIGALVNTVDEISGESCGIISETCRIVIASTIPDSPAQAAGIEAGDAVVAVDGMDITGWTIDEVTTTVRGQAGTDVTLTMLRDGETFEVTITRAAVEVPVVTSERFGSTGYVRFNQFTDNGDEQLREAIFELMAESIDTLVLDLRDNPGGLLTTAIDVASQFLEGGDVVQTVGPESSRTYEVNGSVLVPDDIEVVIVVNGGSASASELLSALLQERGRAIVVGVNTFGKNTVQQQFDLSNGGALKLTIARWVTPGGLDFGEVGVTPDVIEEFPPELTAEAVVDLALSIS
jgi:carboxyl-terminal processing protease